jgi:hypothetical protein
MIRPGNKVETFHPLSGQRFVGFVDLIKDCTPTTSGVRDAEPVFKALVRLVDKEGESIATELISVELLELID